MRLCQVLATIVTTAFIAAGIGYLSCAAYVLCFTKLDENGEDGGAGIVGALALIAGIAILVLSLPLLAGTLGAWCRDSRMTGALALISAAYAGFPLRHRNDFGDVEWYLSIGYGSALLACSLASAMATVLMLKARIRRMHRGSPIGDHARR